MSAKGVLNELVNSMKFTVAIEQQSNGLWRAEITEFPDVKTVGATSQQALVRAQDLALRRATVQEICQVRDSIFAAHGAMSDSTDLVREDRDR